MTDVCLLQAVPLPHRGAITIAGDDRFSFFQGLITNDIHVLDEGNSSRLLYACLLTPQGKFLHDFFVRAEKDCLILDCEGGARAQDLYQRLIKYKLRSNIDLSVAEQTPVWQIFHPCEDTAATEKQQIGQNPSMDCFADARNDVRLFADPRHPSCGWRCYEETPESVDGILQVPFSVWDTHRIRNEIPDGSRDLIPEQSYLHEGRLDELNAVSYAKGCYVGQELVSRMHHRGLAKKILKCVDVSALPDGAELRSTCGDVGLAIVRL